MSVVINSSKSVLKQPLSSLCSILGRTHVFCGFVLLLCGGGDSDAGWAGTGFCCLLCLENIMYNKKLNSIKPKRPSSDLSVALNVFLSSLKCEMNGTSHERGVYSVIWILTIDTDPLKQSVLSGRVGNMFLACLLVFTACLFVIRLVC